MLVKVFDEVKSRPSSINGALIFNFILGLVFCCHILLFNFVWWVLAFGILLLAGGAAVLITESRLRKKELRLVEVNTTGVSCETFGGEKLGFSWDEILGVVFSLNQVTIVVRGRIVEIEKKSFPHFGEICNAFRAKGY